MKKDNHLMITYFILYYCYNLISFDLNNNFFLEYIEIKCCFFLNVDPKMVVTEENVTYMF